MRALERFILAIPYLFLKKIPYAWIAVVALWVWPPVVAGILLGIILLGLLMMKLQGLAWEAVVRREHATPGGSIYVDRPQVPPAIQARNLAFVLLGSGLLGYLLDGRLGLTGWQIFFLLAGFMALYKDTLLFGAPTVYMVTDRGVGVRHIPGHIDYRLFLRFNEIRQIARVKGEQNPPVTWAFLTPTHRERNGLLLVPASADGFSRSLEQVFLAPRDIEAFLRHVPLRVLDEPKR